MFFGLFPAFKCDVPLSILIASNHILTCDFTNGFTNVFRPADPHRLKLRPSQMIRQRRKRPPQAVDADTGNPRGATDAVDLDIQRVQTSLYQDPAVGRRHSPRQNLAQSRYHNRHSPARCFVFVGVLLRQVVVSIQHRRAFDADQPLSKFNARPPARKLPL